MATHDKDIVNRMKKRVLIIDHGVLAGDYAKGSYKAKWKCLEYLEDVLEMLQRVLLEILV